MYLATWISSFYLLSAPMAMELPKSAVEQAIDVIRNHHLETSEGRVHFLTEELLPFTKETQKLSLEMQELALTIQKEENKSQIVSLGEELNAKMAVIGERLPLLMSATQIDKDLEQLNAILSKEGPLEKAEAELLLRVASLCTFFE